MLPPGPSAPPALQTWRVDRAADRAAAPRAGALRRAVHAPHRVVGRADGARLRPGRRSSAVFAAPPDVLRGGESSSFLEPFVGPSSILHPRRRRAPAPAQADAAAVPRRGAARATATDRRARRGRARRAGRAARAFAAHARMQALTLDVILRVVFGAERPGAARRDPPHAGHDDVDRRALVAMSLVHGPTSARGGVHARGGATVDELIYARIERAQAADGPILGGAARRRHEDERRRRPDDELRDQLVTLLAAGHETTAGALAWALERLARHPDVLARLRDERRRATSTPWSRRCCASRPVLSIAARKTLQPFEVGGWTLPAGRPRRAVPLPHAPPPRALARPDRVPPRALPRRRARAATRSSRSAAARAAASAPRSPTLEMREVLRAVAARFALAPRPAAGRAHAPPLGHAHARAGRVVIAEPLASIAAMPLFCRHNRLTANCPICSRELEAELRAKAPPRARARARVARGSRPRGAARAVRRRRHRALARAADDGYRNPLVPGLRATADAERLAAALARADARLEPPGPYPAVADEPDREEATWLAFLLALVRPGAHELQDAIVAARPSWASGEVPGPARRRPQRTVRRLPRLGGARRLAGRRRSPASRRWTPERRFGRVFERLALPGFSRAAALRPAASRSAPPAATTLAADALHSASDDDATTLAAKRVLVSGDAMLLERRARDLAEACGCRSPRSTAALAVWGTPGASPPHGEPTAGDPLARSGCDRPDRGARPRRRLASPRPSSRSSAPRYRVEADLIGARTLPALHESPRRLRRTREPFLGAYEGERLVGAVSWQRTGALVDIHRLVVAPRPRSAAASPPRCSTRSTSCSPTRSAGSSPPARPTGPRAALYERHGFRPCRRAASSTGRSRS